MFEICTRAADSRARTGKLHLAHGTVRTPAFVPLATRGAVKTLEPRDVEALGFEMVLGNTFHLLLSPGPERVAAFGGLNAMMRWPRPIITDSGGFQVFSMGHGGVADEIKGRNRPGTAGSGGQGATSGAIIAIEEEGVRFRSYLDGSERFLGPETSMATQAALHSDIALVLDECTPFHAGREYWARSMERTHRWLERCLDWHAEHGPDDQLVYGIVQGGTDPELRTISAGTIAGSRAGGVAIGGSLGQDKPEMHAVVDHTTAELERLTPERPRHLLGIGDIDDLLVGVQQGIDTFDCAMPTRLGRHGVAIVPAPERRWRMDLFKGRFRDSQEPILEGCPCPACARGFTRGYLHYLLRAREVTGPRLITQHNLSFIARLMVDLRAGIDAGSLGETIADILAGGAPSGLALTA
ncbi:MAG TPA: tRNA guanosine(34) transglycosylase Tgt [Solirubrobacteraceae bacterium]|nr:tRNA guanosine(34) transglycosylase Tgt [Solirubrobacteraceae bacterium]